jgi:hypothetical protein
VDGSLYTISVYLYYKALRLDALLLQSVVYHKLQTLTIISIRVGHLLETAIFPASADHSFPIYQERSKDSVVIQQRSGYSDPSSTLLDWAGTYSVKVNMLRLSMLNK